MQLNIYTVCPAMDAEPEPGPETKRGRMKRAWKWTTGHKSDLTWFGISFVIGLSSAVVSVAWKSGREAGIPAFLFLLASVTALTRIVMRRVEAVQKEIRKQIEEATAALSSRFTALVGTPDDTVGALLRDKELSPLALKLWEKAHARLDAIGTEVEESSQALRRGEVHFWGEDDALNYLILVASEAHNTIHAIDHIGPPLWFADEGWYGYLTDQLERSARGDITLERIRAVNDDGLTDAGYVEALTRFVRCHEEARATILLCLESHLRQLKTYFHPSTGMLLSDRDGRLACVTGSVGRSGYVDHGIVYLKRVSALERPLRDYDELRERLTGEAWDEQVRGLLGFAPRP